MKRMLIATLVTLAVSLTPLISSTGGQASAGASSAPVRIGIYDNRPIALAYARSEYNPVSSKMREYEQAKAAGDDALMKKLEQWGTTHQRQLHRQGFSRVPVTDLLEHIADDLPALARELGVDAIVFECNAHGDNVEIVDVTRDVVALFGLSDEMIEESMEISKHDPVDLDELNHDH